MKGKYLATFLIWIGGLGVIGYTGFKMLTGAGQNMAYDKIVDELDGGETCVMTKRDGKPLFVRKVDVKSDSQ